MQLFTPFELAGRRLRNRIVFPAVLSNFARENRVTPRLVDYYAERAAGGAAMLVTEGLAIHASSVPQPNVATVFDAANFEGFQRLAAAVERHDCRLLGQLWHVGRQQLWSPVDAPVGVSALPDAYSWSVPHVMTPDEIGVIARAFVDAARTLQRAGFSGVELHGGHGYLITQFLSPWSNVRDDGYGGDVEGRTRFVREMIAGIRAECGAGFIVGLKMPGDERVPGGIDGDEAGRIAAPPRGGRAASTTSRSPRATSARASRTTRRTCTTRRGPSWRCSGGSASTRGRSRCSRSAASSTPRTPSDSSAKASAISSAWGARSSPMRRCPRRRSPGKRPPPGRASSATSAGPRSTSASRSPASTTRTSGRRAKRRGSPRRPSASAASSSSAAASPGSRPRGSRRVAVTT